MQRRWYAIVGVLGVATAMLLLTPGISDAQRRGGWGGGRGWGGGYGWGGRGYGGYGWGGRGYGGWGLGLGYGGYGWPGYGSYNYGGYSSYTPYYADYSSYAPGYSSTPYYSNAYSTGDYVPAFPSDSGFSSGMGYSYGAAPADQGNVARVTVDVPDPNARVTINGRPTRQRGSHREFETTPISPDRTYTADFAVTFDDNGRSVTRHRTVRLRAGEHRTLSFGGGDRGEGYGAEDLDAPRGRRDMDRDRDFDRGRDRRDVDRDRTRDADRDVDRGTRRDRDRDADRGTRDNDRGRRSADRDNDRNRDRDR